MTHAAYHTVIQGDDISRTVTLKRDGSAVEIDLAATVRAVIYNLDDATTIGPVTCDSGDTGADWEDGVVVVYFPSATTDGMSLGLSRLEIEVDDGSEETWIVDGLYVLAKHL